MAVIAANRDDVVQAQRLEQVSVSVQCDGIVRETRTAQSTVGSVLKDLGIVVGPLDVVTPATYERPSEKITVVRVKEELLEQVKVVPFDTVRTFSRLLRSGYVKTTCSGVNGEKTVRIRIRYEDGKEVNRTVIDSLMQKKPVNKVVCIGSQDLYSSRGGFYRTKRILSMNASAYDPSPRSCGRYATGRTACGMRAGKGVVAVDPRVIRLGTKLYIPGYGFAIAGDKGSAIKGHKIDLGYNTYKEAIRFGRKRVDVHILH
jgi:3D (Asp-Asp-Asp) domain-containing protein